MNRKIRIIGLVFCMICLFSCEKEKPETQKVKTYFDSDNFVSNGLIAYYSFNGDVKDHSGNNNNGIGYNVTFCTDRFGNHEGACKLSGNNSYVKVPNNQLLNKGEYTICFWYRADTINNEMIRAILSKTDTVEGWAISTIRSDNYTTNIFEKAMLHEGTVAYSGWSKLGSSSTYWSAFEPEKFRFTCISFSDTTFLDHNSGKSTTLTFDIPLSFIENDFDLLIGKSNLPHLSDGKGEIDDLLIYNRVLSYKEALKLSEWNAQ